MNDKQPISYFKFLLDPQSFSKSVENIFHFSFLIKEGRASFELDDNGKGLPFTKPLKARKSLGKQIKRRDQDFDEDENEDNDNNHQAIISLTYDDWEDMIDQLDIKENDPMVKHDIEYLMRQKEKHKRAKY